MNDYRITLLERIGFERSIVPTAEKMNAREMKYSDLIDFKERFGHCDVPQAFKQKRTLGKWVSKQRDSYRNRKEGKPSKMTEGRIAKPEKIGSTFYIGKGKKRRTRDRFSADLRPFQNTHGRTNIPLGHAGDPQSGRWAYQQRVNLVNRLSGKSLSTTATTRLSQLKEIGFNFHVDYH